MNRREALKIGAAAAATTLAANSVFAQAAKPQRVLILGGTGFIGPHMIEALRAHGHTITLFNNDKNSAQRFPDLESLFGDRDGKIEALAGRDWDVVVDNSGYVPRLVKLTAEALRERVPHYVFISTLSVFADLTKTGTDEDFPLATLKDPTVEVVNGETYAGLKVLCEQVINQTYGPAKSTIIRPHVVVGPGDPTDRFTYWVARAAQGGEMLAPGSAGDWMQFIDVRDLAAFAREAVERRFTGPYNTCNTAGQQTIGQVIDFSRKAAKADTRVTWVENKFLQAQDGPAEWFPLWMPPGSSYGGAATIKNGRAVAKGLKFQPLEKTVRDTLAWHNSRPEAERKKLKTGPTPEQERELLQKWKSTRKG